MNLLKAIQKKLRFQTNKGNLNIEQLFDLSLQDLDALYLSLEGQIQTSKGLLGRKGNTVTQTKLEIVKDVFDLKVQQANEEEERADKAALKQRLMLVAETKEFEEMTEGKSSKDIKKMIKKM